MLILDIDLLGISGLQLLKELKAGGLTEKMPVVMRFIFLLAAAPAGHG